MGLADNIQSLVDQINGMKAILNFLTKNLIGKRFKLRRFGMESTYRLKSLDFDKAILVVDCLMPDGPDEEETLDFYDMEFFKWEEK